MEEKKLKIALLFICVNPPYWPFLRDVIEDCRKFFLTNHQVDYFTWSDMPEEASYGATVFPIESVPWPAPTLMRYHLFLQQEEILKDYDYIFYLDVDMRVVGEIGNEILGDLMMAEHPMYALRREYVPPYEPNKNSTAYIPRFGSVIQTEQGTPWFKPFYAAGGFQGGKADLFIEAMKQMKKSIDKDFANNYVAIWNDESHWNKYLSEYTGSLTVLSPSYVYPDSLINEYYVKVWGRNYIPRIITLTKKFSTTAEGGEAVRKRLESM